MMELKLGSIKLLFVCLISLSTHLAFSQTVSMSTNFLDWAELGTVNAGASYAVSRHWSVNASGMYNPFRLFDVQLKKRSASLGARYWPWHVYSGWWTALGGRWSEFSENWFDEEQTREGTRLGGGLSFGYSYMVTPHFNIDLGVGLWTGQEKYRKYECPVCGRILESGEKIFVRPDNFLVSFAYVF